MPAATAAARDCGGRGSQASTTVAPRPALGRGRAYGQPCRAGVDHQNVHSDRDAAALGQMRAGRSGAAPKPRASSSGWPPPRLTRVGHARGAEQLGRAVRADAPCHMRQGIPRVPQRPFSERSSPAFPTGRRCQFSQRRRPSDVVGVRRLEELVDADFHVVGEAFDMLACRGYRDAPSRVGPRRTDGG